MPYEITQCHLPPTELTFPPLPQPKLVLDLTTPEGCKAELTCIHNTHNNMVMVVAMRCRESRWSVRGCWYYASWEHHCQSEFIYCTLVLPFIRPLDGNIAYAKIRKIVNNSAWDCVISLKFGRDFDHATLDVPRTFKVNGLKVKVTAWQRISIKTLQFRHG